MRLDQALVAQGLAPSRARARALVEAGVVRIDGKPATRRSQPAADAALSLAGDPCPWVSRAALKLVAALDHFALDPSGAEALDLGASTGGFTEVLLARGAARVHAVDVGHGQLHARLAGDPRVVLCERLNARELGNAGLPAPSFVTADLSFISLTKALPPTLDLAQPGATLVALVKPQFEAGPGAVGKGGILRDPAAQGKAVAKVTRFLDKSGWQRLGICESPIKGADGNQEWLLAATKPSLDTPAHKR